MNWARMKFKERPVGIKFLLFFVIFGFVLETIKYTWGYFYSLEPSTKYLLILVGGLLCLGVVTFLFVLGLLKAGNWFRILLLIIVIYGIYVTINMLILLLPGFLRGEGSRFWIELYVILTLFVDIILSPIAIWFLAFDKKIKLYFKRKKRRK